MPNPQRFSLLAIAFSLVPVAVLGCKPAPPPAPEGLDDSARYMVREFYKADPIFEAGLNGFMNWFDDEGYELVGEMATAETTDSFTVGDLSDTDVANFPLLDNPDRVVANAKGVVSLAEMECSWLESEDLLVRKDQDVVFDAWEAYTRTYVTSRPAYQDASRSEVFEPIADDLDVYGGSFEVGDLGSSLMLTTNLADPKSVIGVNLPEYEFNLDFRHGLYDIDGVETLVFAIVTFLPQEVFGPGGDNGLRQSYSIELNVARDGGKTLRVFAVWAEPISDLADPDDPFVLNYAVNTAQANAQQLSDICSGDLEIPPEPD